jgi:sugar phosphate permease
VWALAFWLWFRNRPEDHSGCNDAERELIDEGRTESKEPPPPALPILALLRSPNMWLISGVNLFSNIGWVFLATWLPKYLENYHKLPKEEAGFLSSITAAAGMTGCILGGFASDYFVHRLGMPYGRKAAPMISLAVAIVLYVLVTQTTNVYAQVALFTGIWFCVDFELSSRWGASQDVGGRHTATVMGFGNMCGNLGAAFFSGYIGEHAKAGEWNTVFTIACFAFGCVWLCWAFIDVRVPIVPEPNPPSLDKPPV